MNKPYDLVVFDWDGTLMDSESKIVRCFTAACDDAGILGPGPEAIRDIIGLGLDEAVEALLPDCDRDLRTRVVDNYRQHFLYLDDTTMDFFPGVLDGLEQLERQGYLLAVATGKARRGLDRLLKEWKLERRFVATRCADEAYSKPHPKMLEDLLALTGCPAERALMVGDTVYDMEMARNARMHSLAVSYGVHHADRLLPFGPQACLDSFDEVLQWLGGARDRAASA